MAKEKKKRASKYDEKPAINDSFDDMMRLLATPYTPAQRPKPKPVKPPKKKSSYTWV